MTTQPTTGAMRQRSRDLLKQAAEQERCGHVREVHGRQQANRLKFKSLKIKRKRTAEMNAAIELRRVRNPAEVPM